MTQTDLYDYYLDRSGHLNRWMRGGTGVIQTVPGTPENVAVSITSGGVATVTWSSPLDDGGSTVTGYTVTRIGGATHTLGVVFSDNTFTGLTAGTTYSFTVAAVNAIGTGTAITVSGSSTSVSTIWGINNNQGVPHMTIAARKAWFDGRMPVLRVYASPWNTSTPTFGITSPEGRTAYSWKEGTGLGTGSNPGYSETQLGNGTATPAMVHFLQSIPANEQVWWGFHHEVNSGSLQSNGTYMEVAPANYLAIYHQMRLALNSATLQSNVQVIICCNFSMNSGLSSAKFSNAWVPPRSDCDVFTFDGYGDPSPSRGPNKYGGYPDTGSNKTSYDSNYPLVSSRLAFAFSTIQATGYADSWGVWEFNAPQRNWDTSPQESGRILWHNDYIAMIKGGHGMTGAVPAKIALFWEADQEPFATWIQTYGRLDGDPSRLIAVASPLITGTPVRR